MRIQFIRFGSLVVIGALLMLTSCTKESTVADPAGTTTTNINYTANATPVVIYEGAADDGSYIPCPNCIPMIVCPYVKVSFGMNSSVNFVFQTDYETEIGSNNPFGIGSGNGQMSDMGAMKGLGYVTDKPTSGFTSSCAVTPGHGYVLRIKRSRNYNDPSLTYTYGRVYVDRYVLNNSNGIIGAVVKVQYPF
jgi:hypothetical protein